MTTYRKRFEHWTETKRVIDTPNGPVVKQVTCVCTVPASKAMECATARGCKTRCRCFCHSNRVVGGS